MSQTFAEAVWLEREAYLRSIFSSLNLSPAPPSPPLPGRAHCGWLSPVPSDTMSLSISNTLRYAMTGQLAPWNIYLGELDTINGPFPTIYSTPQYYLHEGSEFLRSHGETKAEDTQSEVPMQEQDEDYATEMDEEEEKVEKSEDKDTDMDSTEDDYHSEYLQGTEEDEDEEEEADEESSEEDWPHGW